MAHPSIEERSAFGGFAQGRTSTQVVPPWPASAGGLHAEEAFDGVGLPVGDDAGAFGFGGEACGSHAFDEGGASHAARGTEPDAVILRRRVRGRARGGGRSGISGRRRGGGAQARRCDGRPSIPYGRGRRSGGRGAVAGGERQDCGGEEGEEASRLAGSARSLESRAAPGRATRMEYRAARARTTGSVAERRFTAPGRSRGGVG